MGGSKGDSGTDVRRWSLHPCPFCHGASCPYLLVPCPRSIMSSFCQHCDSLIVEGTRSAGSFRERGNVIDLNLHRMWKRIYWPSPAAQQPFAKQVLTFCAQLVVYMYRHRHTHTDPCTHAHTHTHFAVVIHALCL